MTGMAEPLIVPIRGRSPEVHPEAWVAPNASLIGQVRLAARASVWYAATLRAEAEPIDIGAGTNIQDGVTIHVDSEFPVRVGNGAWNQPQHDVWGMIIDALDVQFHQPIQRH